MNRKHLILSLGLLTILSGAALAQNAPATQQAPASAASPAAGPAGQVAPTESREDLIKARDKALAQNAEDKRALVEAKKGTDKSAVSTLKDKVKADGQQIHAIDNKLHALKLQKKAK